MRSDDLKDLNERFYQEVFRNRNVDAIDDLLTDDFVEHTPAPGQPTDRDGAKEYIGQVLEAFPDLAVEVENQVAEGDTVSSVLRMTGTHRGEFAGVPATGRTVSVHVMDTARVRGSKFCEHWGLVDVTGMMAQLGR